MTCRRPLLAFSQRPRSRYCDSRELQWGSERTITSWTGSIEELITNLARSRYLPRVIARNSSFAYRGRPLDIPSVCTQLGARYLIEEGSIQKNGDRLRIIAQLIDGQTGHHLWAERFESSLADLDAVRDEIAHLISGAVHGQVYSAEVSLVAHRSRENLGAWY